MWTSFEMRLWGCRVRIISIYVLRPGSTRRVCFGAFHCHTLNSAFLRRVSVDMVFILEYFIYQRYFPALGIIYVSSCAFLVRCWFEHKVSRLWFPFLVDDVHAPRGAFRLNISLSCRWAGLASLFTSALGFVISHFHRGKSDYKKHCSRMSLFDAS